MSKNDETSKSGQSTKIKPSSKKNILAGMNINKLTNMRIIQKHLVYVIGLRKYEYFGQYGNIQKIVVNKTKAYNPTGPKGPSYSGYISYSTGYEASVAILAIDNIEVDDHVLRASFGTTKYCSFFLKNCDCPNKDCLYLHYLADDNNIVNRDDMNSNTSIFYDQQLLAIKLADIYNPDIKNKLKTLSKKKTIFPNTESIYLREIVIENNPIKEEKILKSNQKIKNKYSDEYYNEAGKENNKNSEFENKKINFSELEIKNQYENFSNNNSLNLIRDKSEKNFTNNILKNKFSTNGSDSSVINNNKFISKSKSPINIKKKLMNLNEASEKTTNTTIDLLDNSSFKENEKKNENLKDSFSVNFIKSIESNNLNDSDNSDGKINKNKTCQEVKNNSLEKERRNSPKPVLKLYRKWDRSRFSFVNKKNEENKFYSQNICENNSLREENTIPQINDKKNCLDFSKNLNNNSINIIKKFDFSEEDEKIEISSIKNKNINKIEINENNNQEIQDIVPDYVYDVIRRKISRHTFFKKFEKEFPNEQSDYLYFEKVFKYNDTWSQFIINNIEKPKIK